MTATASTAVATPARCRPIEQRINGLLAEQKRLQEMLMRASPVQKPELAAEMKQLSRQIAGQRAALTRCKNAAG
jgi:hypothetical protein